MFYCCCRWSVYWRYLGDRCALFYWLIEFSHSLSQRSSPWSQSRNPFGNKLKKKRKIQKKKNTRSSTHIIYRYTRKKAKIKWKGNRETRHIVGEEICGKRAWFSEFGEATKERQNIRKQTPTPPKKNRNMQRQDMLEGGGNTSLQGVGICANMTSQ